MRPSISLQRLAGIRHPIQTDADTAGQVMAQIEAGVTGVLAQSGVAGERVLGVGVPGIVERAEQPLVHAPLWGWRGLALQTQLRERLGLPVLVDNGASRRRRSSGSAQGAASRAWWCC